MEMQSSMRLASQKLEDMPDQSSSSTQLASQKLADQPGDNNCDQGLASPSQVIPDMNDGDEGLGDPQGTPLPTPSQLDADMESAQHAAEEDEEHELGHAEQQGWQQQPLPDEDPGHLPSLEESSQRRLMYPAGRILHLVPAKLVFEADELAKLIGSGDEESQRACLDPQATAALMASTPLASGPVIWPKPPPWVPRGTPTHHSAAQAELQGSSARQAGHSIAQEEVQGNSAGQAGRSTAQTEVQGSTAALAAASAAPQTPLEVAASVAAAVPGPHQSSSPTGQTQQHLIMMLLQHRCSCCAFFFTSHVAKFVLKSNSATCDKQLAASVTDDVHGTQQRGSLTGQT